MNTATTAAPDIRVAGRYPIRTLAAMTGVNPVTLRAWERRYGLLKPTRTAKGHRLYDDEDVQLVRQVVDMLDSGIPISRAAQLAADGETLAVESPATDPAPTAGPGSWEAHLAQLRAAIEAFDATRVERIYNEVQALYPIDVVTARLVVPTLAALGERWKASSGGIAEEHFFSVFLRNKLGARFHHLWQHNSGPKLVTACLPGELHELGLLLFGLSIASRGYRLIQLGANTPLDEVGEAALRSAAAGVVLSGSPVLWNRRLETDLSALAHVLAIPVMVGGEICRTHEQVLAATGAHVLGTDLHSAAGRLVSEIRAG